MVQATGFEPAKPKVPDLQSGAANRICLTCLKMAERVGFEPTDAFTSTVFKTAALSRSAISLKMEVTLGFEPRKADYKSAVLPIKTMRPKYPYADSNRSRLDENQVS